MTSDSLASTCRTHSKGKPGDPSSARTAKDQSSIISIEQGISRYMPVDKRTFAAEVAGWVTEVLNSRPDLPFSYALVEDHVGSTARRHDFRLYRRHTGQPVLTGEIKPGFPRSNQLSLDIAPSGIPSIIIPHSKGVQCGLIRSNSPFSYSNHRPAKPKIPKPLVYAQVSPLGTSFATP